MSNNGLKRNKAAVRGFVAAINERRLGDLPDYMATDVVDHNKIIFGEPDEPGGAGDPERGPQRTPPANA